MTQPSSVNKTFDTSLIDTRNQRQDQNRSFSSTETNTSGSSTRANTESITSSTAPWATMSTSQPHTAVSNTELYSDWASTYDIDGNVLQAVDDLELRALLPKFIELVCQTSNGSNSDAPLRILDFGCGTGRNTLKLLQADWGPTNRKVEIYGWDGSEAMLEVARRKCSATTSSSASTGTEVTLAELKQMDFGEPPSTTSLEDSRADSFDGIVSTLVLEHLPLELFFTHLRTLLKPDGFALVTNMHPDMGHTTRAGYKTADGRRVKGQSWVHSVEGSARVAKEAGLDAVGEIVERGVDEGMIERSEVGERGRKWVGVKVWYGFVVRKGRQ